MAALDFILALEWPCRDHVNRDALSLHDTVPAGDSQDGFHGHALTATQAVICSAQSRPQRANTAPNMLEGEVDYGNLGTWVLPHSEIDK